MNERRDARIIKAFNKGITKQDIAQREGISGERVRRIVNTQQGLCGNCGKLRSIVSAKSCNECWQRLNCSYKAKREKILKIWYKERSVDKVADKLYITVDRVRRVLAKEGVFPPAQ